MGNKIALLFRGLFRVCNRVISFKFNSRVMAVSEVTCEDNMVMMARYPDKFYQLALVDPPYGININNNMGRRKGDKSSSYKKVTWDSCIPDENYFRELFRVSENQIIWGGIYMTEHLPPSSCWLLWDKGFSEDVTFAQFEMAWTSFSSSAKKYDKSSANPNRIHPTEKPVSLYKWCLKRYAKPGDKILDTHLGSQSHRIAAYDLGFDFYACEADPTHFKNGNNRFENHIKQLQLFPA